MACLKGKKTRGEGEDDSVSKRIEAQLRQERAQAGPVKILLLGTGASGKSTFLKQLKVIHKNGFSATEIDQFRVSLPRSSLQSMQKILQGLLTNNIKLSPKKKAAADKILEATELSEELAAQIKDFWAMDSVKEVFEKRSEYGLHVDGAAPYYLENVERFAKADFVPTNEDMLRARIKTTGIREIEFNISGREFLIVDVGGQRSERRKWIHCFDLVHAIIYLAALDEYDMKLEEDNRTNCLEESLQLFTEITGSEFFANKSLAWMLFLNKTDLLEAKIKTKPLSLSYKDFPADMGGDFKASVDYIAKKFRAKYRGPEAALYIHNTCTLDTKSCEKVFHSVRDRLLNEALEDAFS